MLGKTVKMIVWKGIMAGTLAAIVFAALVDCANAVSGGSGSSTPSLSLNSTKQDLVIGLNPYQLTATVSSAGSAVTWTSSNAAVATVSTTGLVTPVAIGSATITATSGTLTATCAVTSNVIFATGNAQVSSSNTGNTVPVYWYNGVLNTLPTGSQPYGTANGYTVNGADTYIGGDTWDASYNYTCVYWKNGTLHTLTPPSGVTYRGDYESIEFDSSGNWYMRGSFTNTLNGNSYNYIPGYWYNGTFTRLSMTLPNGTATSGSAGSGDYLNTANGANDYYVNGYLVDPTTNLQVPVYWKNGVVNVVPMGSIATASVNGGSVQAILPSPDMASLTALITGNDAHWNSIPAYVVNGTVTPISTGSYSNGVVWWAWTTSSGDIYAEGEVGNSTNFWGTGNSYYWKNWVLTPVTPPTLPGAGGNSLTCNSLNSLSQIGNQVVYSATFSNTNGLNSAVYWIQGGAATALPVSGYAGGSVSSFGYLNFVPASASGNGTIGTTINSIGRTK